MITNKYIIVDLNDIHLDHILECTVESLATARKSIDQTKIVVKLPENNEATPKCCEHLTVYTHEEILPLINSLEWQIDEEF